jgi:hypothetical protein
MAMSKRTNNDLQSTTQKTKDRGTRTQLKTRGDTGGELHIVYGFYHDILDRGLLLPKKLLNQGFLLKSLNFTSTIMTWLTDTNRQKPSN